jgi:hypothetical protein
MKITPQKFDPHLKVDEDWEKDWHLGMNVYPPGYVPGQQPIETDEVHWTRTHPDDGQKRPRKLVLRSPARTPKYPAAQVLLYS